MSQMVSCALVEFCGSDILHASEHDIPDAPVARRFGGSIIVALLQRGEPDQ